MANRRRNLAKEQFWRQVMAQQGKSPFSVRAFCEREGFSESSFYMWRRELAKRDHAAVSVPSFVPVEVVTPTNAAIEIVLPDGLLVRVQPGFDRHTLGQVVALLAGGRAC